MGEILVGCPVLHREWVLDAWFDHVEASASVAGLSPSFIFVGDPERDPKTFAIINRRAPAAEIVAVDDVRPVDRREWHDRRYRRMVELRNHLLDGVRRLAPPMFLSLDSDILLHPSALDDIVPLLKPTGEFDAVGGFCHLAEYGTKAPSYGFISRQGRLQRRTATEFVGPARVDVLLAIKLMSPAAYAVDYVRDLRGEDTGWAKNCKQAGLVLGWSGRVASKHLFTPARLDRVDPRIGW